MVILWTYCLTGNNFLFFFFFIALQCCVGFCQTSTRISHRYTYVSSPLNLPPTLLPIPPFSQSFINKSSVKIWPLGRASLVAQMVKNLPAMQETWVQSLDQKDPLEKEMANPLQYSCLENSMDREAWGYSPWYGRVGSMGSKSRTPLSD